VEVIVNVRHKPHGDERLRVHIVTAAEREQAMKEERRQILPGGLGAVEHLVLAGALERRCPDGCEQDRPSPALCSEGQEIQE